MKNWQLGPAVALLLTFLATAQSFSPSDALAFEQQGKLAEAAQAWRTIVQRNPLNAAAFASLGLVLSKDGKYADAVTAYRKAIVLNPQLPGVQLNLGLAEFKRGRFQAAITPLTSALAADPQSMQARTLLGLSYFATKRFLQASTHLELVARSDPANTELRQLLAQSCLWARKYSCALDEFRQILERDPDSASAHILAAEALDGLGKTPEAIVELQAAARVAPREPNLHFGLGYLYWKLRQYDGAATEFKCETAIDPNHGQALAYLGDIELRMNRPEEALVLFKKAVHLRNDIRIAYLGLGTIFAQQHHYHEAMAALRSAEKLDPAQPDVHLRLGRLYQILGNTSAAQKEFAKLRELHQKANDDLTSQMSGSPQAN